MKTLLLNKDNVIIDIVDTLRPVCKNKNDITVLCDAEFAEGYIGSDNNTIYSRFGHEFTPGFTDIASSVIVSTVPEGIKARAYKYAGGSFIENTDPFPLDDITISVQTTKNTANTEYLAMMAGITL